MAIPLIGLGAGGHAKVVIEILRSANQFQFVGLMDSDPKLKGRKILGVPVLGNDSILPELLARGIMHFFVGVGTIGDSTPRRRLYEMALEAGMLPVSAVHPQSVVSPSATIGSGVTIMAGAVINACTTVGVNVIINTGGIVEHDCVLGDHVHVATGARLAGTVRVLQMAHIGAGAIIRQGIEIGEGALVAAGAVVIKDVAPLSVVAGVPARCIQKRPSPK